MSELTITAIRLGLLALLWAFVFSIVGVLRGDLYGARTVTRGASRPVAAPAAGRAPKRRGPTHLAVVDGHMRGITVPLTENGVLIGRNPECSLVLSDEFASGRHARVYPEGDQWFVDDLGSTNGTFVGPQRIGEHVPLHEGSHIRIGTTVLEVRK
ncbi:MULTISPECIES: FHA domain-containing protein [Yimella]|uniref:Type III secretion system (T3SS) inner membrane Yop/YscD-like protein n=1 Tax=Yimella lutea TaxID=587872 RepID=A0A542ECL5_9MICO|nr:MULTISPECIES: FHA domain-containing protein [Yimella]MCG8656796.1 FHA domain-containing protein [Yimella sp. NH-Cas1]RYG76522.1 FHA domain-containing protein [Yimella sp. RIT 621]TQJ13050.1 type III secretion system (T3SS) inner membrane Yop/YscD-like protein [Yimella lutea]